MDKRNIAKIAVSAAIFSIDRPYSYLIPNAMADQVQPGVRVTVPFGRGNRRCEGVVLSVEREEKLSELKAIESVLDDEPVLSDEQLKLALWMRDRFFSTMYDAVRVMLPAGMWFKDGARKIGDKTQRFLMLGIPAEDAVTIAEEKHFSAPMQSAVLRLLASIGEAASSEVQHFTGASAATINTLIKRGYVESEIREVFRTPVARTEPDAEKIILNREQKTVFEGLRELMRRDEPEAALLHGVTGSGKTSIYIELAHECVRMGRTAIILVPEIALTPQFVEIFSSHFGRRVAVLHSSLTMGERYDEWKRIRAGLCDVVIGTRSAIFAPLKNLGLIVIDEEQEHTYKSESSPRYSARDVAKYRCVRDNALLLLGSATPSVESMYAAERGKYKLFTLRNRYNLRPLPEVHTVNMRSELKSGNGGVISSFLRDELRKNLENGEQSILFLNRRGASSTVVCGECGYTYTCPNCSVSMTYHSVGHKLMCHYCGHAQPLREWCPECGGKLKFTGAGTQKAEEELHTLFPDAATVRLDADTVAHTGSHERILEKFRAERIPFLLGTQMVTKGLDFENVTLVGVLSADQSLYAGDYRARERTFSLITQVVGRAGRGSKTGRAVIQTFTPENETIKLASVQDYSEFFRRETELRAIQGAPPFTELISVTVSGLDEAHVLRGCVALLGAFRYYTKDMEKVKILGPSPAGVAKVNNRFRYRLMLSCENTRAMRDMVCHVLREFSSDRANRGLAAFADSDPLE